MSAQPSLFDQPRTEGGQRLQLARVKATIGAVVRDFCRARLGEEWHASELRQYVAGKGLTAPASPDRILRALRQRGDIAYVVVSRQGSLYRVTDVRPGR